MALALFLAEERAAVEFAAPAAAAAAAVDTGLFNEVTSPPPSLPRLPLGDVFVRKVKMKERMGPRQLPVRRMVQSSSSGEDPKNHA